MSSSYVDMTIDTLRSLGGRVTRRGPADFEVVPTRLTARAYAVEGDHSAASYFLAAPAVIGAGTVRVDGLRPDSRQPDAMLGRLLETRGARVGRGATWVEVQARGPVEAFDLDLSQAPDLAPTVAQIVSRSAQPTVGL